MNARKSRIIVAAWMLFLAATPLFPAMAATGPTGPSSSTTTTTKAINAQPPPLEVNIPTVNFTNVTVTQSGKTQTINIPWLGDYLSGIYRYAVGAAAVIAAALMMMGGFQYLTAGGDMGRVKSAKDRISNALVGLLLAVGSYLVANAINPDLTQFRTLQINMVRTIPFPSNETPISDVDNGSAPLPPLNGSVTPTPLQHFGQCSPAGRAIHYTAKDGRCATQTAGRHAGEPYTICSSGCGIASAAMVIGSLIGQSGNLPALVKQLAQMSSDNGFRTCDSSCGTCHGTAGGFFTSPKTVGHFGLQGQTVDPSQMDALLAAGHPLVALYGKGLFTSAGHFVVIAGKNPDGTYHVLDPARNADPRPYSCASVRRSSFPDAPCNDLRSDHVPAEFIHDKLYGLWYIHQ